MGNGAAVLTRKSAKNKEQRTKDNRPLKSKWPDEQQTTDNNSQQPRAIPKKVTSAGSSKLPGLSRHVGTLAPTYLKG
jgi:hypothetical protein